jgi:hypothetical protein
VDVLGDRGGDDLLGREPDALIDHLEAGVPGPHRDLLGAVAVSVQAGLADEHAQLLAELLARAGDLGAHGSRSPPRRGLDPDRGAGPRWGRGIRRTGRAGPGPLAGRDLARAHSRVAGMRFTPAGSVGLELARPPRRAPSRRGRLSRACRHARIAATAACSTAGSTVWIAVSEVGGQRVGLGRGELVEPDDDVLPGLDPLTTQRVRGDQGRLHVAGLDGHDAPPIACTRAISARAPVDELGHLGLDDDRAVEEVVVFQQVGLVGQHLLHAQRPLLVPGPRQAERLVPGRQLHGAGPGVLGQRDASISRTMRWTLFSGCCFGQAQRVDLHAVAEAARFRVGHAIALAG